MNQRKKTFRVTAVLILVSVLLLLPVAVTAADSAIDADQNIVSAAPTRSGAFENWKQNDPRWRDQSLGYSSVGRSGCYVTSLAMILVASGLERDRYENGDFNPGIFAEELREAGFIGGGGGLDLEGFIASRSDLAIAAEIDGADFDPLSEAEKARLIEDELSAGRFVFIITHNPTTGNRHAVVAAAVENGRVCIDDPGYTSKTGLLFEDYPSIAEIIVFAAEAENADAGFNHEITAAVAVGASSVWNELSGI